MNYMPSKILSGKELAQKIKDQVAREIKEKNLTPHLAVIRVGEDAASQIYIKGKIKACQEVGINLQEIALAEKASQEELERIIKELNNDSSIDALLVQLPLPKHLEPRSIINCIDIKKDVDGLTATNLGYLFSGEPKIIPATPLGIVELLKENKIQIEGKKAVVVGRSNLVGRPIAALLEQANATVTVCHRHTKNLGEITKQADILICAVGKPALITKDMVKKGAVVIDVGINRIEGKLIGDVDFEQVKEVASAISPVPGGVGPLTVACLLKNIVKLTEQNKNEKAQ